MIVFLERPINATLCFRTLAKFCVIRYPLPSPGAEGLVSLQAMGQPLPVNVIPPLQLLVRQFPIWSPCSCRAASTTMRKPAAHQALQCMDYRFRLQQIEPLQTLAAQHPSIKGSAEDRQGLQTRLHVRQGMVTKCRCRWGPPLCQRGGHTMTLICPYWQLCTPASNPFNQHLKEAYRSAHLLVGDASDRASRLLRSRVIIWCCVLLLRVLTSFSIAA